MFETTAAADEELLLALASPAPAPEEAPAALLPPPTTTTLELEELLLEFVTTDVAACTEKAPSKSTPTAKNAATRNCFVFVVVIFI